MTKVCRLNLVKEFFWVLGRNLSEVGLHCLKGVADLLRQAKELPELGEVEGAVWLVQRMLLVVCQEDHLPHRRLGDGRQGHQHVDGVSYVQVLREVRRPGKVPANQGGTRLGGQEVAELDAVMRGADGLRAVVTT